jgi:hypothetical protein
MLSYAAYLRHDDDSIMVQEGSVYLDVKMAGVYFQFCAHSVAQTACTCSLIHGGGDGGLSGSHVLILLESGYCCDVTGITNNAVTDLPMVQAAGLIQSSISCHKCSLPHLRAQIRTQEVYMKKIISGIRYFFSGIPEINNSAIFSTYEHCVRIFENATS